MNYGYQNELDFVELFDNKFLKDLDLNSQQFLVELYGNNIDNSERIKAWKNKTVQKADMFVKYGNRIKSISLKCGRSNSMHHEQIQEFKRYLWNLGLPFDIINYYMCYHFGYKRDKNGNAIFTEKLSSEEYKKIYQKEIDIFNESINKTRIIVDMIDRFIIRGRNSDYDVDALVCGTIDNYVWIMKYDLYDLILSKRCMDFSSPHIACMTLGPKKRDLDSRSINRKDKYLLCVRWNFIRESIIEYRNNNPHLAPFLNK